MDFDLSADQLALQDGATSLLDRFASRDAVRAHVGPGTVVGPRTLQDEGTSGAGRGFDAHLWQAMADQGWLAVERPGSEGGLGMGMVEIAVLCEAIGRHVAPAPFLPTVLAVHALSGAGTAAPSGLLEALYSGRNVGCVADGRRSGSVEIARDRGAVRLTGRPEPVIFGPSADVVVVLTPEEVFLVAPDAGVRPRWEPSMDVTRELGWLVLEATPAIPIGGVDTARRLLDRAAAATAAELLGVAAVSLEMAVAYAKDRVQFGKPIGSFQAVKHMLADALVDVEGMRSAAYYAAWCVAADDADSSLSASIAKSWCSDAARRVTATALQVHGGIGFTWEHDMHLYLKRAQLSGVSFGDAAWHRDRITDLLQARVGEGRGLF